MIIVTILFIEIIILFIMFLIVYALQINVRPNRYMNWINGASNVLKNVHFVSIFGIKGIFTFCITIILYIISSILVYSLIKVLIASLILSLPVLLIPFLIFKAYEIKEKKRILKLLPVYALNLKNNIKSDNNIVLAIKRTKVDKVIKRHIDVFVKEIDRGVNIYDAFNKLDKAIGVSEFSDLIHAFQVCFKSGGEFAKVLDMYSKQVSEKLLLNEKEQEKSLSTIITLVVMVALNVMMLFMYIPKNYEVQQIFSSNMFGRLLIDLNAIATLICLYFLFKIYKMEE